MRGVNQVPVVSLRALLLVLMGLTLTVGCSALPTSGGVTDGGEPPVELPPARLCTTSTGPRCAR